MVVDYANKTPTTRKPKRSYARLIIIGVALIGIIVMSALLFLSPHIHKMKTVPLKPKAFNTTPVIYTNIATVAMAHTPNKS